MVKHIILWQLKDELSPAEKISVKAGIKTGLESLAGKIPGLLKIQVHTDGLPSSNADVMLDSSFTDADALKTYAAHPEHLAVADSAVLPFTKTRLCLDFES
ncbi:MAG: Dabb family protein [Lentisphaeria bacterium]|nr:Dabb family protein [Lentisphaeria bacterium]